MESDGCFVYFVVYSTVELFVSTTRGACFRAFYAKKREEKKALTLDKNEMLSTHSAIRNGSEKGRLGTKSPIPFKSWRQRRQRQQHPSPFRCVRSIAIAIGNRKQLK
jgi:hypothetical protein